jgi:hypothetical protein
MPQQGRAIFSLSPKLRIIDRSTSALVPQFALVPGSKTSPALALYAVRRSPMAMSRAAP